MSIFKDIFGKTNTDKKKIESIWELLIDENQLDAILQESNQKPIIIFKHSTRCGTSMMVKNRFQSNYNLGNTFTLYYLDLIKYRNISNKIENLFNISHQSPQLIIIKHGKVIAYSSHYEILNMDLSVY